MTLKGGGMEPAGKRAVVFVSMQFFDSRKSRVLLALCYVREVKVNATLNNAKRRG